jgi:VIT1/CCC1 family predicted Fe2+/Mn2+ transporter
MKHSLKTGFSFGLTSGIITTLGLMVGLHSGTHSRLAVIGGILTIAIADAFSDALGIHMSEESEEKHPEKEIWESTIFTFIFKFIIAASFVISVLLFPLEKAVIINITYGLVLLGLLSFYLSKKQGTKTWAVILEHMAIGLVVVIIAHYIGDWINKTFN